MAEVNENEVFDWDDEIEDDGTEREFVTLEPGTYDFEVTSFERAYHEAKPGGKAPSCPKAVIKIKIASDKGDCYITENFLLYKKMEWKISQFFKSLGMKKSGEKVSMKWDDTVGMSGSAKISKDKGDSPDVFFNHVKEWIEKKGEDEWS